MCRVLAASSYATCDMEHTTSIGSYNQVMIAYIVEGHIVGVVPRPAIVNSVSGVGFVPWTATIAQRRG